jgi:hypothetical protein
MWVPGQKKIARQTNRSLRDVWELDLHSPASGTWAIGIFTTTRVQVDARHATCASMPITLPHRIGAVPQDIPGILRRRCWYL